MFNVIWVETLNIHFANTAMLLNPLRFRRNVGRLFFARLSFGDAKESLSPQGETLARNSTQSEALAQHADKKSHFVQRQ